MLKSQKEHRTAAFNSLECVALENRLPENKSDDELLTALSDLTHFAWQISNEQWSVVQQLRSRGATWQEIGDALGTTRSAAQQRFGQRTP